jgi:hypothetical protein
LVNNGQILKERKYFFRLFRQINTEFIIKKFLILLYTNEFTNNEIFYEKESNYSTMNVCELIKRSNFIFKFLIYKFEFLNLFQKAKKEELLNLMDCVINEKSLFWGYNHFINFPSFIRNSVFNILLCFKFSNQKVPKPIILIILSSFLTFEKKK